MDIPTLAWCIVTCQIMIIKLYIIARTKSYVPTHPSIFGHVRDKAVRWTKYCLIST